ncbi:MAG: hypothetical protein QXR64_04890 [Pyrobaculum sp.]
MIFKYIEIYISLTLILASFASAILQGPYVDYDYISPPPAEYISVTIDRAYRLLTTNSSDYAVEAYAWVFNGGYFNLGIFTRDGGGWTACNWSGDIYKNPSSTIEFKGVCTPSKGHRDLGLPMFYKPSANVDYTWVQSVDLYGVGSVCILIYRQPSLDRVEIEEVGRAYRFRVYVKAPASDSTITLEVSQGGKRVYSVLKTVSTKLSSACVVLRVDFGPVEPKRCGRYDVEVVVSSGNYTGRWSGSVEAKVPCTTTGTITATATVTPTTTTPPLVRIVVSGDYATWRIKSSVDEISGSGVGNWNARLGGTTDVLYAEIVKNPYGYVCTINPASLQVTAGGVYEFRITCARIQPVTVTVKDPFGVWWKVAWSGSASGERVGSGSGAWEVQPGENAPLYISAQVVNPLKYTDCIISPSSAVVFPGQNIEFSVNCASPYVNVVVIDSLGVMWRVKSGKTSTEGRGSATLQIELAGRTDVLTAEVVQNPPGYMCEISPRSVEVSAKGSVTFTITCKALKAISVIVDNSYGATWRVKWSGAAEGTKTGSWGDAWDVYPTSQASVSFEAAILASPPGMICSVTPTSVSANPGELVKFVITCTTTSPQPLTTTVTITQTGSVSELTLLALAAVVISAIALALSLKRR